MDSVLSKLTNFDLSGHPNNPSSEHPHFSLYKAKYSGSSQEERRIKLLQARKESRYDLLSHLRNIEENGKQDSEEDEEDMNVDEPKAVYKKPREYCNFVMLSEWLVDVPEDFNEKYIALLCPVGKRCLCVCYRGWTSIYAKNGKRIKQFPSLLPGGSGKTYRFGFTVLDCIWSEVNSTFYILDLIFWYKQSFIDCDALFRFEWLKSRAEEFEEDFTSKSKYNKYRFVPLPFFQCNQPSLVAMFNNPLIQEISLDGLLFYHRETHYTHGPSPLVCWLKPFMLSEILGVSVPSKYMEERPAHYTNITSHIVEFDEERKQKANERKKRSKSEKMDAVSIISLEENDVFQDGVITKNPL